LLWVILGSATISSRQ